MCNMIESKNGKNSRIDLVMDPEDLTDMEVKPLGSLLDVWPYRGMAKQAVFAQPAYRRAVTASAVVSTAFARKPKLMSAAL